MTERLWEGTPPTTCDICERPIKSTFIYGRTTALMHAYMCPSCHKRHGLGLGLGKGQKYVHGTGNRWLKAGG